MAEADLVVIPCRPSPLDVEAISVMVELCQQHGHDFVFVLTGTTPRSAMTAGARDYLKRLGDVLEVEITHRQSYSSAMILGGAAPEKDATARAEIAGLWEAILKRLKVAARKRASRKGSPS
jgi:chromosome partitioning protein